VTRWAIDAEAWRQRMGFHGGESNTNSEVIAETFESAGAYVMGRRMADGGEIPWGADPPFRARCQVISLGLLDELELHIVPVILGDGMGLLTPQLGLDSREGIELTPERVIATPDVTHVRYQLKGRRELVLYNRGRDEEPAVA